ncbi:glycosyltransferase [Stieleria sp. TO1_6]|uniref:glycosyltransferase family protein n=1 Tax=Stieleria tagensis TaxID=2956795 RepID=UPI00209AF682|nr:glycosyltransferase [Stieleria tagensis]MCO8122504.1 glycosyltransferase [Stieleria tagensis]
MPKQSPIKRKVMYVSWAESCSRSDQTARELGGQSLLIYLPVLGSHPVTILPKYCGQFFMTAFALIRYRPRAVIVMSPPIVAAFAVLIYHLLTGRKFALDCHTAAFLHPRWNRLQWLQHLIGRRASINIVHNEHLAQLVEQNGGKTVIVKDVPVVYESGDTYELSNGPNVTAVCSFNPDEPIGAILDAAKRLPEVQFYLTGNPKHLSADLAESLPINVKLTGFVSDSAFGDLLIRSDIVMSLTTRDHTMLRGAWEAIYQGTPVIVSDWPVLKQAFPLGALHVDNSPEGIAEAVSVCLSDSERFRCEADQSRLQRTTRWHQTRDQILRALNV